MINDDCNKIINIPFSDSLYYYTKIQMALLVCYHYTKKASVYLKTNQTQNRNKGKYIFLFKKNQIQHSKILPYWHTNNGLLMKEAHKKNTKVSKKWFP